MLNKIESANLFTAVDGVIFKKEIIDLFRQKERIQKQAERNAKKIIKKAKCEAEEIKIISYSEGYQDGLLKVFHDVIKYITKCEEYSLRMRGEILDEVKEMLTQLTEDSDFLVGMICQWLATKDIKDDMITLLMPQAYESLENKITNDISYEWGGGLKFDYHDKEQIIIICGKHFAQFSCPEFVTDAIGCISDKYDILLCEDIKAMAREQLNDILKNNEDINKAF